MSRKPSIAAILIAAAIAAFSLGAARPGFAADPVALVEDVSGNPAGVDVMDYLATGKTVKLGGTDRLVIDYLRSCVRETITGGIVTIGADESRVVGGAVKREKVQCDGGKLRLTTDQAAKSGAIVFRGMPKQTEDHQAERTLYGSSPVVDLKGAGTLVIERLDQPGDTMVLKVEAQQLTRGTFYDLAKFDRTLAVGGLYRATCNGHSVVFKVDPSAQPGAAPLAGRLLRL
jgi:hypothetical protein